MLTAHQVPAAAVRMTDRHPEPVKGASMKVLDTPYQTLDLGGPAPGIVVVTLNRPDRYNAMTATMFDELERAAIALDDEDELRAVILTGAGKAFCAGYDLADAEELPKPH
jgi:enoyl-CoA hydratase/carnithine racemase